MLVALFEIVCCFAIFLIRKMSCLPKPVLRGHITRRGIKSIIGGLCLSAISSSLYWWCVAVPRREAYENFMKTYDPEAHFKELVKYGYITFDEVFVEEYKSIMNQS